MAEDVDNGIHQELTSLKKDLYRVRDDLVGLKDSLMAKGKEKASIAKDVVGEKMKESCESIDGFMREKPLTSALIVFGAGMLLGRMFLRR